MSQSANFMRRYRRNFMRLQVCLHLLSLNLINIIWWKWRLHGNIMAEVSVQSKHEVWSADVFFLNHFVHCCECLLNKNGLLNYVSTAEPFSVMARKWTTCRQHRVMFRHASKWIFNACGFPSNNPLSAKWVRHYVCTLRAITKLNLVFGGLCHVNKMFARFMGKTMGKTCQAHNNSLSFGKLLFSATTIVCMSSVPFKTDGHAECVGTHNTTWTMHYYPRIHLVHRKCTCVGQKCLSDSAIGK